MLRPMFATNIAAASHATHVGLFAQLSDVPHSHVRIRRGMFRNANLAVLGAATELHSRSAGLPFSGLRLPFDPSVWMSHTTGQVVQTEEALFAVARHPILLLHVCSFLLRIFVVQCIVSVNL